MSRIFTLRRGSCKNIYDFAMKSSGSRAFEGGPGQTRFSDPEAVSPVRTA